MRHMKKEKRKEKNKNKQTTKIKTKHNYFKDLYKYSIYKFDIRLHVDKKLNK